MEVYISELDIETYRGIKNLKMENLKLYSNQVKKSLIHIKKILNNQSTYNIILH